MNRKDDWRKLKPSATSFGGGSEKSSPPLADAEMGRSVVRQDTFERKTSAVAVERGCTYYFYAPRPKLRRTALYKS